jgi:hypothetical protein
MAQLLAFAHQLSGSGGCREEQLEGRPLQECDSQTLRLAHILIFPRKESYSRSEMFALVAYQLLGEIRRIASESQENSANAKSLFERSGYHPSH